MSTLGERGAALALRLITKYGTDYSVYQGNSLVLIGTFKGVQVRNDDALSGVAGSSSILPRSAIQLNTLVFYFIREFSVGERVLIGSDKLTVAGVDAVTLQGSFIVSKVTLQK